MFTLTSNFCLPKIELIQDSQLWGQHLTSLTIFWGQSRGDFQNGPLLDGRLATGAWDNRSHSYPAWTTWHRKAISSYIIYCTILQINIISKEFVLFIIYVINLHTWIVRRPKPCKVWSCYRFTMHHNCNSNI